MWTRVACVLRALRGKGVGLVGRGSTGPGAARDAEGWRAARDTAGVTGGLGAACALVGGAGAIARRLDLVAREMRSAGELGVVCA